MNIHEEILRKILSHAFVADFEDGQVVIDGGAELTPAELVAFRALLPTTEEERP